MALKSKEAPTLGDCLQISADFLTRYIRSPATRSASCAQICSDVDLAETTVIIPFAIIIIVVII